MVPLARPTGRALARLWGAARRPWSSSAAPPTPPDGAELCARIDVLGDVSLDRADRHDAFSDLYAALTPPGFRLMPWPDETMVTTAKHDIKLSAVLVDEGVNGQVAARIERHVLLDDGFVSHDLLHVQRPYRGSRFSHVLLNQAFPFYRAIGLRAVVVHAALETGRWHWARMGFEFSPADRSWIESWATLACLALRRPPLAPGFPPSELALLGFGPTPEETTMNRLHAALDAMVTALRADPNTAPAVDAVMGYCDNRSLGESMGHWSALDADRFAAIAAANKLGVDDPLPIGKAIMLAGPDWSGVFDLNDPTAQLVFDAEFNRAFSRP